MRQEITIYIDVQAGSNFQLVAMMEALLIFMRAFRFQYESTHKKNKIDFEIVRKDKK